MADHSDSAIPLDEDESDTYRLEQPDPPPDPSPELPAERPKRKRRKRPRPVEEDAPAAALPPEEELSVQEDVSWEEARRQKEERLGYRHGAVVDESADSLVSAVWYPLTGYGVAVLPLYALLLWVVPLVPIPVVNMLVSLAVGAYVGLLFLETAHFTLERVPSGPRFPGLDWETFSAGMMALVAMLIARLPHMLGTFLMARAETSLPVFDLVLRAVGMVYIPMAFLALAELENERALNPLLVVRGIGRMAAPYFALVAFAVLVYLGPMLAVTLAGVPELLADLVSSFLLLYVLTALMRAMAVVYRRRGVTLEVHP